MTFDDTGVVKEDTGKVLAGELTYLIPEIIRNRTFEASNTAIYSCKMGQVTPLVVNPFFSSQKIGPICRRILLYFRNRSFSGIDDFISKMIDVQFDRYTNPSVINRDRGVKNLYR